MMGPPSNEILFDCRKECGAWYFDMVEAQRYNVKWKLKEAEQWYLVFKKMDK